MVLTKAQIRAIKIAWIQAQKAQEILDVNTRRLCDLIVSATGVEGNVDSMPRDGFGFAPESNDMTHIGIGELIALAENGVDINEGVILENLVF